MITKTNIHTGFGLGDFLVNNFIKTIPKITKYNVILIIILGL